MKFSLKWVFGVCLVAAVGASAEYKVELTLTNGTKRVISPLVIQGDAVVIAAENVNIPLMQFKTAVFLCDPMLSETECNRLFRRGSYEELVSQLDAFLEPMKIGLGLKGNLDVYVQYRMRALFWLAKYDAAMADAQILLLKMSDFGSVAKAYEVLIQLEQGASSEVVTAGCTQLGAEYSSVKEYARARLAMKTDKNDQALQHFSNILVFNERDPEWVSAATFYEGLIYKKTGFLEVAKNVVKELEIAYPDGYWSRRVDELK